MAKPLDFPGQGVRPEKLPLDDDSFDDTPVSPDVPTGGAPEPTEPDIVLAGGAPAGLPPVVTAPPTDDLPVDLVSFIPAIPVPSEADPAVGEEDDPSGVAGDLLDELFGDLT